MAPEVQRSLATLLHGHNKLFLNSIEALCCVLDRWQLGSVEPFLLQEHERMLNEAGELVGKNLNAPGLRCELLRVGRKDLAKAVSQENVARRALAHPLPGLRGRVCEALRKDFKVNSDVVTEEKEFDRSLERDMKQSEAKMVAARLILHNFRVFRQRRMMKTKDGNENQVKTEDIDTGLPPSVQEVGCERDAAMDQAVLETADERCANGREEMRMKLKDSIQSSISQIQEMFADIAEKEAKIAGVEERLSLMAAPQRCEAKSLIYKLQDIVNISFGNVQSRAAALKNLMDQCFGPAVPEPLRFEMVSISKRIGMMQKQSAPRPTTKRSRKNHRTAPSKGKQ